MSLVNSCRVRLTGGIEIAVDTAGDPSRAAVVLLHGFPSSARTFRHVMPPMSKSAYLIAPDLPGFGRSDVLPEASFEAFADAIDEVLERLSVGPRYLYLHDFGAPVALDLAMRAPDLVSGLIIQNANAHHSGLGPQWQDTQAYWAAPNPQNEAAATAHLTLTGTRDQYIAGLPAAVAAHIDPQVWEHDWKVMCLPGRLEAQRALIADYAHHVARFDAIAEYLAAWQPEALLVWGRHDAFFDIAEVLSWLQTLPRMEAHIFDAGHFLLETHASQVAPLIEDFVRRGGQRQAVTW